MRNRLQEKNERTRGGRPPLGTPCSSCRSSATILSALHETFIWTRFEEGLGQSRIAGRGGRAVECGGLENRWASLRSRGFESPPLRRVSLKKPRSGSRQGRGGIPNPRGRERQLDSPFGLSSSERSELSQTAKRGRQLAEQDARTPLSPLMCRGVLLRNPVLEGQVFAF